MGSMRGREQGCLVTWFSEQNTCREILKYYRIKEYLHERQPKS